MKDSHIDYVLITGVGTSSRGLTQYLPFTPSGNLSTCVKACSAVSDSADSSDTLYFSEDGFRAYAVDERPGVGPG